MWLAALVFLASPVPAHAVDSVRNGPLICQFDASGIPVRIRSAARVWLDERARVSVRNEVTDVSGGAPTASLWSTGRNGLRWDLSFTPSGKRVGYEVTIDLPVLAPGLRTFTPSNDPEIDVAAQPAYRPVRYGKEAWDTGQAYVLPLISVLDPKTDEALTVALPADAEIPHLQFEWIGGRVLRLTLGHRAMGGGKPASLRLLFYTHAADYRGALKVYSSDFPAYFEPALPRGNAEGTFWYHHIQDHPDFAEMARQSVRYMWSSFWFTWLGDYLPDAAEWEPFTYARMWKLGEKMSDAKINAFVSLMRAQGIGVYAYLNVTEYGGTGGATGDAVAANRVLREKFADALVKDERDRDIPTWEGAMVMNPRHGLSLWPEIEEQVRRHLRRLPGIEGFVIDRLDWACYYDYGHYDGVTMIGDRPAENMAAPVAQAVQSVCRLAHEAGKRVFVNQFYRLEVLRDVDGYCHENDYVPALAYLAPYRPVSAWHMRASYDSDLLEFEKQLKLRLQFAVFPQMIAHQFPISQQKPNPQAADMLELYAPLFDTLIGKRQVLEAHCVGATGDNDVNLFINGAGEYVAPLTSRTRQRSRGAAGVEAATITVRVPDAARLKYARVYSADGEPYDTPVMANQGAAVVRVTRHATASVVVLR
ncbi:MAG: hypothetical protein ACLQBJ_13525 [Bryobacteraceae bacterium]